MDRKVQLGAQENVKEIPKKNETANQSNKLKSLPAIYLGKVFQLDNQWDWVFTAFDQMRSKSLQKADTFRGLSAWVSLAYKMKRNVLQPGLWEK